VRRLLSSPPVICDRAHRCLVLHHRKRRRAFGLLLLVLVLFVFVVSCRWWGRTYLAWWEQWSLLLRPS
jgi:hypothetical protein